MGKLEPPVLVIPSSLRTEFISEALPIEIEHLQEDIVGEGHGLGRGPIGVKSVIDGNLNLINILYTGSTMPGCICFIVVAAMLYAMWHH
jgi:hypothetical protein